MTENKAINAAIYILLIAAVGTTLFNQYQVSAVSASSIGQSVTGQSITGQAIAANNVGNTNSNADPVGDAIRAVIPTGTPAYASGANGATLSYDDPVASLSTLGNFERTISFDSLSETQKQRYVKTATTPHTACEFCCGIGSRGFGSAEGRILCGCEHNQAFSGLTKYLLKNYENQYTDEQIFQEIQKWKALFFPKQMVGAYLQQQAEQGNLDPSLISQLPGQVGGC